jgi:hypothetical protein
MREHHNASPTAAATDAAGAVRQPTRRAGRRPKPSHHADGRPNLTVRQAQYVAAEALLIQREARHRHRGKPLEQCDALLAAAEQIRRDGAFDTPPLLVAAQAKGDEAVARRLRKRAAYREAIAARLETMRQAFLGELRTELLAQLERRDEERMRRLEAERSKRTVRVWWLLPGRNETEKFGP